MFVLEGSHPGSRYPAEDLDKRLLGDQFRILLTPSNKLSLEVPDPGIRTAAPADPAWIHSASCASQTHPGSADPTGACAGSQAQQIPQGRVLDPLAAGYIPRRSLLADCSDAVSDPPEPGHLHRRFSFSQVTDPRSGIHDPGSTIHNPGSTIRDPGSTIPLLGLQLDPLGSRPSQSHRPSDGSHGSHRGGIPPIRSGSRSLFQGIATPSPCE